jgi:hypothetical protein
MTLTDGLVSLANYVISLKAQVDGISGGLPPEVESRIATLEAANADLSSKIDALQAAVGNGDLSGFPAL